MDKPAFLLLDTMDNKQILWLLYLSRPQTQVLNEFNGEQLSNLLLFKVSKA